MESVMSKLGDRGMFIRQHANKQLQTMCAEIFYVTREIRRIVYPR